MNLGVCSLREVNECLGVMSICCMNARACTALLGALLWAL